MNMYKVYNLPILQPILHKTFYYCVEGGYLALLFDGDHAAIPEHDMLTSMFMRRHMCQFNRALYQTQQVSQGIYILFLNEAEWIKVNLWL